MVGVSWGLHFPWPMAGPQAHYGLSRVNLDAVNAPVRLAYSIDRLSKAVAVIAIWLTLICALISAGNAGMRYAFDISSNAWLEMQWYMFGGMVLLGAPHLLTINGHIRVDLFYSRLNDRQRAWLDLAGLIFFLQPLCIYMVLVCWPWFLESWTINEISNNAGGLVRWPVKLLFPIGFGLLVLQGCSEIIKRIAALKGVIALNTHYERPLQ